jgi:hypothetical protein
MVDTFKICTSDFPRLQTKRHELGALAKAVCGLWAVEMKL